MLEKTVFYMRWAKLGVVTAWYVGVMEIMMIFTSVPKRKFVFSQIARNWAKIILGGSKISIGGVEHIPANEGVIFVCNHQSNMDIPALCALLPTEFRWLSKVELFAFPLLGRGLGWSGSIPVWRGSHRKAMKAMFLAAKVVKDGDSVVIFPEGTWGDKEGRMRPFKKGVLILAKKSGAKVVPITIKGTGHINPPDTHIIRNGEITLIVHPAMDASFIIDLSDAEWMERLRNIIGSPLEYGATLAEK